MTDPSKERIAAALRLAQTTELLGRTIDGEGVVTDQLLADNRAALVAYRATLPRPCKVYEWSRVPAELWANLAHECCAEPHWAEMRPELLVAIQAVQKAADVSRPTTDSGPSSVDTPDPPPVPVSPAGADLTIQPLPWHAGPSGCHIYDADGLHVTVMPTREMAQLVATAVNASGPPGVAAAKESTDNAAALEGAANHERECNCDQALELQQQTREQAERLVEFCRLFNAMHDLARQMFDLTKVGP
jgi:hypothetical protein